MDKRLPAKVAAVLGAVIGMAKAKLLVGIALGVWSSASTLFTIGALGSTWVSQIPALSWSRPFFVVLAVGALPLYGAHLLLRAEDSFDRSIGGEDD